ncbi:MAG: ASCH domain-containing protein [Paludibacteraceae bacterium]|nr:ASCH domain-containing protein [Paludibacteraceae bacterium]
MENKNIIISIHPCYIEKIFSGEKTYEYRKKVPSNLNKIIVYATSPIKKIVAVIDVEQVISDKPDIVWQKTKKQSGISKEFFSSYFKCNKIAYAIKLKNIHKLNNPQPLSVLNIKNSPQSYIYIGDSIENLYDK